MPGVVSTPPMNVCTLSFQMLIECLCLRKSKFQYEEIRNKVSLKKDM